MLTVNSKSVCFGSLVTCTGTGPADSDLATAHAGRLQCVSGSNTESLSDDFHRLRAGTAFRGGWKSVRVRISNPDRVAGPEAGFERGNGFRARKRARVPAIT